MLWKKRPVAPPSGLHIETNKHCNSRCKTCMMWTIKGNPSKLAPKSRCGEIVEEFAKLNPRGKVFICGGETLLCPDRMFAITRRSNALGLPSQMATNGSPIDEQMAEQLVKEGPSIISVSLNSLHSEVHDYTRGRPGSFDEVGRAIRLLRTARSRVGRDVRVGVHTTVSELNYRELEAFCEFVLNELGVDRVNVGFLQPTFHLTSRAKQDRFFADNVVRDENALCEILHRCNQRFPTNLVPAWIEQVRMYHRSIRKHGKASDGWLGSHGTDEHICGSYDKNVVVDCFGMAHLCFSPCFRGMQLRRIGDLEKFWRGAGDIRRKMRKCRAYCGIVDVLSRVGPRPDALPESDHPTRAA